jgi:hypothetical protein
MRSTFSPIVVCTLFENEHHKGVAAMINSLCLSGFTGRVVIGYRGALPSWALASTEPAGSRRLGRITREVELELVPVQTERHLTLFKPQFMLEVAALQPSIARIAYIDPDVVIKSSWQFLEHWLSPTAICLIEDAQPNIPSGHPLRAMWAEEFTDLGLDAVCPPSRYYNAGFVMCPTQENLFLRRWRDACEVVARRYDGGTLKRGGPTEVFHSMDQDALNYVLGTHRFPISGLGPEAMDFAPGGYLLSHAVGTPKPWDGRHLAAALRGVPPSLATKAYFRYVDGPVHAVSRFTIRRQRLTLKCAALIGRFYRRF